MKYFSDELFSILKDGCKNVALKYYHTFVGSGHMFIALFKFLSSEKSSENKYSKIYEDFKNILNAHGVNGSTYKEAFEAYYPKGVAPDEDDDFNITTDAEYNKIISTLKARALEDGKSMDIEDLIFEMFSDTSFELFNIMNKVINSEQDTENMFREITDTFKTAAIQLESELDEIEELVNLNKWVHDNPQKILTNEESLTSLEMSLGGRTKKSAILTGPSGCGKSAVIYDFCQQINSGNVPSNLKNKLVYQLDTTALIAGTRYRGDFEEKIRNIAELVKSADNVILYVNEIHTLVKLGDSSEGANNASSILKPYIERGELQIIGETTDDKYHKHIESDKAFCDKFHKILVNETNKEETKKILESLIPVEKEFFGKEVADDLVDKIIKLSDQYSLSRANPGKAIDMLELACSYSKTFEDQETPIGVNDLIESIKKQYKMYISESKLEDCSNELHTMLLGQNDALERVCENLEIVDAGFTYPNKPLYTMILAGPTGTGKTETAKIIAKTFFGSEDALININMNEFKSDSSVSKLLGSDPGLIGSDKDPKLIASLKQHPQSVILFDEIEKAHPSIYNTLQNLLDEGYITDNTGNKISARNSIIIFTTNLGCKKNVGEKTGAGLFKTEISNTNADIEKAISNYFAPDFLARINDCIIYKALTNEIAEELIERERKFFVDQTGIEFTFNNEDIQEIIKSAQINVEGARGIKIAVQRQSRKALKRV